MKTGISQLVLCDVPFAEFFARSAAAGYEVVELCMRREGELTLDTSSAQLEVIAEQARQSGLAMVSMCHSHCTGNLLDSGDAQQTSIDETCAGLQLAANLGIDCTLHTLGRLQPDIFYDVAYRNAVTSLREIAGTAEVVGVSLAVEFVWNGFLFSPLEMKRFLDEVGSDRIGFYFDPGNMAVFQYPHHWVRILARHIKMVHLKDWKGGPLDGGWPPLLEGEIDYAAMNRELRAAGYDGSMISEVPPSDAPLELTAEAIRKIIAM